MRCLVSEVDAAATTVVRASVGLMYEPPLLDFYDNAILNNGDPKSYNAGPLLPASTESSKTGKWCCSATSR